MIKENTIKNVIIHEDKIKNYFFKRETEEYLKIKNPINYLSSTID